LWRKRKGGDYQQDEERTARRWHVVDRISEVCVRGQDYFEDDRFHSVRILSGFAFLENTQNCVRIVLRDAGTFC